MIVTDWQKYSDEDRYWRRVGDILEIDIDYRSHIKYPPGLDIITTTIGIKKVKTYKNRVVYACEIKEWKSKVINFDNKHSEFTSSLDLLKEAREAIRNVRTNKVGNNQLEQVIKAINDLDAVLVKIDDYIKLSEVD